MHVKMYVEAHGARATSGVILRNPVHLLGDRVFYWPKI